MRRLGGTVVAAATVVAFCTLLLPGALAETPAPAAFMPTQAELDGAAPTDGSAPSGYWGDMSGGNAARPYVTSLSVTNGSQTTQLITNGTTTAQAVGAGDVTADVIPVNLCRSDQTPSPGVCYTTPNRVQITLAYGDGGADGWNFADPGQPLTTPIDANSVVDMTIALNTLGESLRWSWINGDLLYWHTENLGTPDAKVEIKFRPAIQPYVASLPAGNGCSATPPRDCSIAQEDGYVLSASLVLSLDDTLDQSLTGAAFATQRALFGYLEPAGSSSSPSLDIYMSSTHEQSDGSPQLGTLEAFIPAAAIVNLYGALPADDTTVFSTTRAGDSGTNGTPTYTSWSTATHGSDGLFITVPDITFSIPQYLVRGKLESLASTGATNGKTTAVTATTSCSSSAPCRAYLYDLGSSATARYRTHATALLSNVSVASQKLALTIAASRLPAGHRYLLYLRNAAGKAVASSLGTVRTGALPTMVLSVAASGTGAGRVTSSPRGISCSSSCSHGFPVATRVTLVAKSAKSSTFAGWSGACSGKRRACIVTLNQAQSVTAKFALRHRKLKVRRSGTGSGTVSSRPAGIDCGSHCSKSFGYGTEVTLTASAASGSSFAGWSGACSGSGACTVKMTAAKSVTAKFTG